MSTSSGTHSKGLSGLAGFGPMAAGAGDFEGALQERLFRDLFENASDGTFIADLDGRFTYVNSAGCRMLGYARDALIGRSINDFIPPEAVSRLAAAKEQLLKGAIHIAEWEMRRSDGVYVPVEVSTKILPDGRWQAFVREITERRRVEEALRLSEAKFAGIYSVSADAIISVDEAQRITMFNEGAEHIFGYAKDEIVGLPLEVLIPERFRSAHRHHVQRFSDSQETARRMGSRRAKIYGRRKNGDEFPTDAAISRLRVNGKTLLTVSIRDISEQVRIENEQRLLAEIGDILVNAGSDYQRILADVATALVASIASWCAVYIFQDEELRRLKVAHSDAAKAALCEALEHYPIDARHSNPIFEAMHTKQPVLVNDPAPEFFAPLVESDDHLQLVREFDPGSFIAVPLIARGRSLGAIALGAPPASHSFSTHDVREAEKIASRVALAVDNARLHEALERAIQARDSVLGIVAHDLRSPLHSIVAEAQILAIDRNRRDAQGYSDYMVSQHIHRAATSMNRLIQDLLDVTRVEAGQTLAMHFETVATQDVLDEAIDRHRAAFSACGRELRLDAPDGAADVCADRARLLQVFDNLLGNAIKFSRASTVVRCRIQDREALFSVTDDGPGIGALDLPRLFDRFWQADRMDRRGAGLGLSIVKGIVNAHKGRVWVDTAEGEKTTFCFTIPLA